MLINLIINFKKKKFNQISRITAGVTNCEMYYFYTSKILNTYIFYQNYIKLKKM